MHASLVGGELPPVVVVVFPLAACRPLLVWPPWSVWEPRVGFGFGCWGDTPAPSGLHRWWGYEDLGTGS